MTTILAVSFFVLVGLCFCFFGGLGLWSLWKFSKRALRLPGVVVSYKAEWRRRYVMYDTVAEFEFDGKKWKATMDLFRKPKIGASCIVEVDPDNIKNAYICSKGQFVYFSIYLLIGIGIVGGIITCWLAGW